MYIFVDYVALFSRGLKKEYSLGKTFAFEGGGAADLSVVRASR